MRTEQSFIAEYKVLAEIIVIAFTVRFKKAVKKDSGLSAQTFLKSTSKAFHDELERNGKKLRNQSLRQGIDPGLTLTEEFQKISREFSREYVTVLLKDFPAREDTHRVGTSSM